VTTNTHAEPAPERATPQDSNPSKTRKRRRRRRRAGGGRSAPDRVHLTEEQIAARADSVPELRYPAELPITEHVEEIRDLLQVHQVVVVAGDTGSGKTTQLPKIALAAGYGVSKMIGHTQPRRLAARAVASRVAEELGVELGEQVGFSVRFSDQASDKTLVKMMTDGILLTEIRHDRNLTAYDLIIIDEAHERSLNIDFLLGYLQALLKRRQDLRLVITSATIDESAFASHFGDAPIVRVSGRSFPVSVEYVDHTNNYTEQLEHCFREISKRPNAAARFWGSPGRSCRCTHGCLPKSRQRSFLLRASHAWCSQPTSRRPH